MSLLSMVTASTAALAEPDPATPAGGAATTEILIAGAIVGLSYLPLAWFLMRERSGHKTVVSRVADKLGEWTGLAPWAALPALTVAPIAVLAGFGVYWDVPLHMQVGRDEGPLANPSHYPILFALMFFLMVGVVSAGIARDDLPRRTIALSRTWQAPLGSFVLIAAGLIAMIGFPLDDLWHRLFGQDVTEWGPTHVMMIGGAVTAPLSVPLLIAESIQVGRPPRFAKWAMTLALATCVLPVAFLMEFDLGIPQFPAATLFILSGVITAWVFLSTRLWFGPGGALIAWATYFVIRLIMVGMVAPLPDIQTIRFNLYLGVAVVIELVLLIVKTRGPVTAGLTGAVAGAIGLALEWPWMAAFMPFPLPPEADRMPLLVAVGTVAAAGGGLLAWAMVHCLARTSGTPTDNVPEPRSARPVRWVGTTGVVAFLAIFAVFAPPMGRGETTPVKDCDAAGNCRTTYEAQGDDVLMGHVTYANDCVGQGRCRSKVTVRIDPEVTDEIIWFGALSYQGYREHDPEMGTGIRSAEMVPTGRPGEFTSDREMALYGRWKTILRLHLSPTTMLGIPVHMPEDKGLDTPSSGLVQVDNDTDAALVYEPMMLQRERKPDVPTWLWSVMYGVVIACWLALFAAYGWLYSAAARKETRPSLDSSHDTLVSG